MSNLNPETLEKRTDQLSSVQEDYKISPKHRESLRRTQRIASMVRGKDGGTTVYEEDLEGYEPLEVMIVDPGEEIPPQVGVYLLGGEINAEKYSQVLKVKFKFEPAVLSGKVDSAHAVIPGSLEVTYQKDKKEERVGLDIAAKGFYKRPFKERLERIRKEIEITKLQANATELYYQPVAVAIAPPLYEGKSTDLEDYDVLLVTRLDESLTTLDNAPWQLGFTEDNLILAEQIMHALGRYNTNVGIHHDAKVKNFVQQPDGKVSAIDFETSEVVDCSDPSNAANAVWEDLGRVFDSLDGRGFMSREPHRKSVVISALTDLYLAHWEAYSLDVQEAVLEQAGNIIKRYEGSELEYRVA
jgi:hypothetical protein